MKTVAFIPARSGSKGIVGKNIKSICGKPLIAWSIEHAKASKQVDQVYVSTNCPEIAEISKKYGAKIPFLRPENISDDHSTTESAVEHFCNFLDEQKLNYENILLIQCTSPIRAIGRFDDAITNFENRHLDSLVPVSKSKKFLWKNFEAPVANYNFLQRPRRQDIPSSDDSFEETGSFYLFKKQVFSEIKNRICGNVGLYMTPMEESFDIDTMSDFFICESLINSKKECRNFASTV